ncbi:unnamed protein product [Closterium sp. NIES-54]
MLEFAFNNAPSSTIKQSPFFLNYEMDTVVPTTTTLDNLVAWRAGACGGNVRRHSRAQRQHLPLNNRRQQKKQQVEAGAAAGGATVAAGGNCRCLADFRHHLTLPPTAARAAVREREEEGWLLARHNLSLHSLTLSPFPLTLPPQPLPPLTADPAEGRGAWAAAGAGVRAGSWR